MAERFSYCPGLMPLSLSPLARLLPGGSIGSSTITLDTGLTRR
jgi:hypothetical protein